MKKSKYSLINKIHGDYYIFNTLYGTLDLINEELSLNLNAGKISNISDSDIITLIERKHLVDSAQEKKDDTYLSSISSAKKGKFYIIMSYNCNLRCSYCFEKDKKYISDRLSVSSVEKLFHFINRIINNYNLTDNEIILYGGEPLLIENYNLVCTITEFTKKNNLLLSIITNGTGVPLYKNILLKYKKIISIISITIDGDKNTHDMRRIYADRSGSFDSIILSIKLLAELDFPVSIRINYDSSMDFNYSYLSDKLFDLTGKRIPISINRVEDNTCVGNQNLLKLDDFAKKLLLSDFSIANNQNIKNNVRPVNQILYSLYSEEPVNPLIKYCNLGDLYTFEPDGNVYACPESTSCESMKVGNYINDILLNEKIDYLMHLNSFTFSMCSSCSYAPICGSGCYLKRINTAKDNPQHSLCYKDEISSLIKFLEKYYIS